MRAFIPLLLGASAVGCAAQQPVPAPAPRPALTAADSTPKVSPGAGALSLPNADPFPSTYRPFAVRTTVIRNATIMTAAGPTLRGASILLRDGKITAVGMNLDVPSDATVIDGTGKFVTPGIIDTHTHLGVYPAPGVEALSDGNEATSPSTPNVWAEHSIYAQDPQFPRALASGVTTVQVLPGSANLIGGRGVTLKVVPSRTVRGMKFPGAKYGLKHACGENPKRVYANRGPSTRMGNVAGWRAQYLQAEQYRRRWDRWLADRKGEPPARDLNMETLAEVLRGNILVQWHCYTANDMEGAMEVADEFGFQIRSFHHGVEAYKLADLLAQKGISASLWSDWGGFKVEAMDGVRANIALVHAAGARAIVHSDDASGMQRLNQDAAKSIAEARTLGIDISEDEAIRWLTANPAWALGLEDRVGTLEPGKNADVVLWSGTPFSIYSRAEKVWIDGAMLYDRLNPASRWRTDFELGFVPETEGGR
ncbi:MAG: amidohydrolase family protein [Gemmatimonadetes bacterium]|nr:amidohydrolase family protein [Gemmatimonadota bacterium]